MTERKRKRGFSARFVETVKPGTRTKLYCDDNGLYLAVQPSGSRQWVQRLVIRGRRRELGLGGFPLVSLAEAREAAFHNRKLARQGGDPLAHKRKSAVPTFEEAARTVIAIHRSGWRNAKHAAQWDSTLREYAFPRLGKRPVSDIRHQGRDGGSPTHLDRKAGNRKARPPADRHDHEMGHRARPPDR